MAALRRAGRPRAAALLTAMGLWVMSAASQAQPVSPPSATTPAVSPPTAVTPVVYDAVGCAKVRLNLRLSQYDQVHREAAALAEGGQKVRCRIPAPLLASMRSKQVKHLQPRRARNARPPLVTPLLGDDRVGFVAGSCVGAALAGALTGQMLDGRDEETVWILASVYGVGAAVSSFAISGERGKEAGAAAGFISGGIWGSMSAALLTGRWVDTSLPDMWAQEAEGWLPTILATALSAPMGSWIAQQAKTPRDAVAQTDSGGIWGLSIAWMLVVASQTQSQHNTRMALLAGMDVGLIAGAITAWQFPMPRWRTTLIDATALLGGLSGVGSAFLVFGDQTTPMAAGTGGAAGILAGLAAGAWWTSWAF